MGEDSLKRHLNPTVIKGLAYAGGGIFVLVAPGLALPGLRFLLAAIFGLVAISDLWGHRLVRDGAHGYVRALLALAAAIGILVAPEATAGTVKWVVVAYLASTGALALGRGLGQDRQDGPRTGIGRGVMLLAGAIVVFALPHETASIAIVVTAAAAVAVGLLMLTWGSGPGKGGTEVAGRGFALEVIQRWLNDRDLGTERREAIADTLYFAGADRRKEIASYVTMLVLSVTLASLAILQDSTAVIIGAMLIAPLMTPIMGCAAGLVAGWRRRVVISLGVVAASVASAIGLAWVLASWIPALVPFEANSQVLSRASPTLLDMAVALAAGAAGAYATVDERVSQSLTGVAIAVALVPPLSVVGVALEAGRFHSALGALLLFGTNLVSIIVASALVFVLVGFAPAATIVESRKTLTDLRSMVAVAAILIMVPLGLSGRQVIESSQRNGEVQRRVSEWLGPDTTLKLDRVTTRPQEAMVVLSGHGEVPRIAALEESLKRSLGGPISVTVEYFPSAILTSASQGHGDDSPAVGREEPSPGTAVSPAPPGGLRGLEGPPLEPGDAPGES